MADEGRSDVVTAFRWGGQESLFEEEAVDLIFEQRRGSSQQRFDGKELVTSLGWELMWSV